jgi:hypothetical protein
LALKRSNAFIYILLPLILAGLIFGVYELLIQRFEKGDVYPPYSSLRTDPLGARAFYEGLAIQKGMTVERNYTPLEKVRHPGEVTLFDLGEYEEDVLEQPVKENEDVQHFLLEGGRMVVSLVEESKYQKQQKEKEQMLKGKWTPSETPEPSTPTETPVPSSSGGAAPLVSPRKPTFTPTATKVPPETFEKKWGVETNYESLPKTSQTGLVNETDTYEPVTVTRAEKNENIPPVLLWHSGRYFEELNPAWKVVYRRGSYPVMIERAFGKGSLVLMTDSYLVSNEAMQNDRHADFLAYLVGDKNRVLFDETHLGVFESPNMATLMAQYGLRGFLVGLLVLAVFFIWRNSMSLVPPPGEENLGERGEKSGKDFSAGMVNLLKRNIPPPRLLAVCFEQWKKSFAHERKHLAPKVKEMEQEMESSGARKGSGSHPVEIYLRMSKILKKRK